MSNQRTEESKLWNDFRNGERYALSLIYKSYVHKLFRYGIKFTKDDHLVKDQIQELFFDLIRNRSTLGETDNIYFYLIKALRRRLTVAAQSSGKVDLEASIPSDHPGYIIYSIEEEWIGREVTSQQEKRLREALKDLSPKQREILYYRFECSFEYEQICDVMSMKYDSARKMVFRAMQTLRENLIAEP